jgi:sulfate permease, SulP family
VVKVPLTVRRAGPEYEREVIPGLTMLRGYRRAWLPGDLLAGVTVAAYLVPLVP